ncbi:hypothetical protein LG293_16360 (plasmid) [Citricoccus nitrophenolicus]
MSIQSTRTDEQCRHLIRRWQDGQITEAEARTEISGLLSGSGITREVSRECTPWRYSMTPGHQLNEDLQAEFDELLFNKVTVTEPKRFFDLELAANSSVTGWARMTLRSARQSLLRNIHSRTTSRMELVSPADDADEARSTTAAEYAYHTAAAPALQGEAPEAHDVDPLAHRMLIEQAAEMWSSRGAPRRGARRAFAGAEAIRMAFSLPAPIRPDLYTRERLQVIVEADQRAAHSSVKAMLGCILREDGWEARFKASDMDLMALWDDMSTQHLTALAGRTPEVAHALALEAIADRPRPSRSVVRKFRHAVTDCGPASANTGRTKFPPGWRSTASGVCNAYLAEEFEAYSAMDTTGSATHAEKVAGRNANRDLATNHYETASRFQGFPLGRTADEVRRNLDRIMTESSKEDEKNVA